MQIEVPATWEQIEHLMAFNAEVEQTLRLTADQSYLLHLVVEEIATNIVKYGYPSAELGVIQLNCTCDDDILRIVIRDQGQPFDPREIPDPDFHANVDDRQIGGLGIFLVRESADTLHYNHYPETGWNELIITKKPFTMFERLRQIPLFKSFADSDLAKMAEDIAEQLLEAGETLFHAGDPGHNCYVIISGDLEVLARSGGTEVQLEVRHPGQIIGEMALIDRSPRSATVRAVTKSRVALLNEQNFANLLRSDPELAMGMLRDGTMRLRVTSQRMITDLEHKNAELSHAYNDLKAAQGELIRLNRLEEELAVARRIQSSFLPRSLPQPAGWTVAAFSRGAQAVGGDFYDCIELPGGRLGLVVADVCGKGVTAALFVALARSLLRAASQAPGAFQTQTAFDVDAILTGALWLTNDYITREHSESNMFITLFYGVLDPTNGELHYVNAGHNPPLHMDDSGQHICELEVATLPIGITANQEFTVSQMTLQPGDMLVGFSDGITEAMNPQGEPLGDELLHQLLRSYHTHNTAQLVTELVREVDHFANGAAQADDMTLLIIQRLR